MFQWRVRKALKYINDSEKLASGVRKPSKEWKIIELELKYPGPGTEDPPLLPDSVLFESNDASWIPKAVMGLSGAAGPHKINELCDHVITQLDFG